MRPLSIQGLTHSYGANRVLHGIDLEVIAGQVVCILGASGCGKSTLLRCVAGHEKAEAGRIAIGEDVVDEGRHHVPPECRKVGMMFQDLALFPHLTVGQNIAFGLRGRTRKQTRKRIAEVMEFLGLTGMEKRYPDTLSGGQQQRVALARALAVEPHIMLLDEPFSGLDPALRGQVREQAIKALRAIGATCIMVTHDAEEAMATADHLVIMRDGRIVQQGGPEHCYHDPIDEDVMLLFGRCTSLKAHVKAGILHSPVGAWPHRGPDGSGRLLVREEAFHVSRSEAGEHGGVTTKVEQMRNLGAESRTLFRIGEDLSIAVRHPHRHGLRIGEEVHLVCDKDLTCFFPSEQGSRA